MSFGNVNFDFFDHRILNHQKDGKTLIISCIYNEREHVDICFTNMQVIYNENIMDNAVICSLKTNYRPDLENFLFSIAFVGSEKEVKIVAEDILVNRD